MRIFRLNWLIHRKKFWRFAKSAGFDGLLIVYTFNMRKKQGFWPEKTEKNINIFLLNLQKTFDILEFLPYILIIK